MCVFMVGLENYRDVCPWADWLRWVVLPFLILVIGKTLIDPCYEVFLYNRTFNCQYLEQSNSTFVHNMFS